MWLTGQPGSAPRWPAGDVVGRLEAAGRVLCALAPKTPDAAEVRVAALLTDRAAWRGLAPGGRVSAGGRCRMLRTSDGWVALTLARPSDLASVPALVGPDRAEAPPRPAGTEPEWALVSAWAAGMPASVVAARAQLLGLPASPVPGRRPAPRAPWRVSRLGPSTGPARRRPQVVDLSAMWAGPLCAHLLSLAGAEVVKVEDPDRPDAARTGDPQLFALLHRGHRSVALPFSTAEGAAELGRLLETADVVIEGSRPRALAALGLGPERFCASRPGRTWVSITGHGRVGRRSNWVAFGDDAAAGAGLVAAGPDGPVFCGDAIADPVTGLYAATAALASVAAGGGHLVDCALSRAAAYANAGPGCPRAHRLERSGEGWVVSHFGDGGWAEVRRPGVRPAAAVGPAA